MTERKDALSGTEGEIEAIKARRAKIVRAPWRRAVSDDLPFAIVGDNGMAVADTVSNWHLTVADRDNHSTFIAHAPTDIDILLSLHAAQKARIVTLEKQVAAWEGTSTAQLHARLSTIRAETIEECAKVADATAKLFDNEWYKRQGSGRRWAVVCIDIAKTIRSLATPQKGEEMSDTFDINWSPDREIAALRTALAKAEHERDEMRDFTVHQIAAFEQRALAAEAQVAVMAQFIREVVAIDPLCGGGPTKYFVTGDFIKKAIELLSTLSPRAEQLMKCPGVLDELVEAVHAVREHFSKEDLERIFSMDSVRLDQALVQAIRLKEALTGANDV